MLSCLLVIVLNSPQSTPVEKVFSIVIYKICPLN